MVEAIVRETTDEVVKLPAGIMSLVRQSYDNRERVLDWMLAIGVTTAMAYVFWPQLTALVNPAQSVNAGAAQDIAPSKLDKTPGNYMNYNMPMSRNLPYRKPPSSVRVPNNPSIGPWFAPTDEEESVSGD